MEPFHPVMAVDSGSFSSLVTTATSATATSTTATIAAAKSTRNPATATPRQEPEHPATNQYGHKPRYTRNEEEQKSVKPNGQQTPRENREKSFDNPRY